MVKDLFKYLNWVVVGDVANKEKFASKILQALKDNEFNVSGVSPRGGEGIYASLKEVPYKVNCIDLCINPKVGINILKEAKELGIKNVIIQPGAESDEILDYCKNNGIYAIEGCVLVALRSI